MLAALDYFSRCNPQRKQPVDTGTKRIARMSKKEDVVNEPFSGRVVWGELMPPAKNELIDQIIVRMEYGPIIDGWLANWHWAYEMGWTMGVLAACGPSVHKRPIVCNYTATVLVRAVLIGGELGVAACILDVSIPGQEGNAGAATLCAPDSRGLASAILMRVREMYGTTRTEEAEGKDAA